MSNETNARITMAPPIVRKSDADKELVEFAARLIEIKAELLRSYSKILDLSQKAHLAISLGVREMVGDKWKDQIATEEHVKDLAAAALTLSRLVGALDRETQGKQ